MHKKQMGVHQKMCIRDSHGGIMASIMDDLMAHALYYTDLDVVTAHLELDYTVSYTHLDVYKRQLSGYRRTPF